MVFIYKLECLYNIITIKTVRWISSNDLKQLAIFEQKLKNNLARDIDNYLVYLAPSIVNLKLTQDHWPMIAFNTTRKY